MSRHRKHAVGHTIRFGSGEIRNSSRAIWDAYARRQEVENLHGMQLL